METISKYLNKMVADLNKYLTCTPFFVNCLKYHQV